MIPINEYNHKDRIGNLLKVGDFVSYSYSESSGIVVGIVAGFTKKMVVMNNGVLWSYDKKIPSSVVLAQNPIKTKNDALLNMASDDMLLKNLSKYKLKEFDEKE